MVSIVFWLEVIISVLWWFGMVSIEGIFSCLVICVVFNDRCVLNFEMVRCRWLWLILCFLSFCISLVVDMMVFMFCLVISIMLLVVLMICVMKLMLLNLFRLMICRLKNVCS